ncbi:947_t:CDS:2 [Cetraspora pellucida]|uniref:947_t:CDS:1 n=1 Tax=Cetraspora pellucida TaxID=1433469 RepID=A0A9N9E3W6_9GLOM|nr:947_t:CDS:2 [Cetraspora pellucida]
MDNGSLIKDFSNLLESSQDFDTKITVGEEPNIKEFKAHSIILTTRSAYFKTALSSQWVKKENGIIIFNKPNISPSVFEILINYIYTGEFLDNNNVDLLDIFIATDELQLNEIKQKVEKRLLETESAWKFPEDFVKICKHNTFTDLYQTAFDLVCRKPKVIFESKDFSKVEEDDLIKLLKSDRLQLEEFEIWEYLIKWGIENTETILDDDLTKWSQTDFIELEKVLHNCIPHIRFFQLSFDEFNLVTTKYKNILPDDLIVKSFQELSDSQTKHNLPKRELAYSFDSKIIDAKDAALIASWIDKKQGVPYRFNDMPFEFKLIYRASRQNFSVSNFHKICDCKGPTVVIIKVRNSNEIIGGYNPLDWNDIDAYDDHEFKKTSKSFIFSLFSSSNGAIPRLSFVSSQKEAITWCTYRGPCFGFKDLWIEHTSSQGAIGISKKCSYEIGIIDKETFGIEEYETVITSTIAKHLDNKTRKHRLNLDIILLGFLPHNVPNL